MTNLHSRKPILLLAFANDDGRSLRQIDDQIKGGSKTESYCFISKSSSKNDHWLVFFYLTPTRYKVDWYIVKSADVFAPIITNRKSRRLGIP